MLALKDINMLKGDSDDDNDELEVASVSNTAAINVTQQSNITE